MGVIKLEDVSSRELVMTIRMMDARARDKEEWAVHIAERLDQDDYEYDYEMMGDKDMLKVAERERDRYMVASECVWAEFARRHGGETE